ncbi:hypothetical protein [Hoeflea sp. TYP-13]|uniref:hypothetical protein n=1 Tax=Hoeflea sp. TYP-13 TaxID=3230023 RepID=UPI0034C61AB9
MDANRFENCVTFHPEIQVMEVDFSNVTFDVSATVHQAYDAVDRKLHDTGMKWFFLVNYLNCRIMTEAWIAFAHRGKNTNLCYSLGSARYAASGDTSEDILESAKQENFDPNLFRTRDDALAYLAKLRSEIPDDELERRRVPSVPKETRPLSERVTFHPDLRIMEVDFSDYVFARSADVNKFYDEIDRQITATGNKWYFMVNYKNTEILPDAWHSWAVRGGRLNSSSSLGTVRFDPNEKTKEDIRKRAHADDFNPNIVATREEALARIEELKQK